MSGLIRIPVFVLNVNILSLPLEIDFACIYHQNIDKTSDINMPTKNRIVLFFLSLRFKNFDSSRNSLNPTLDAIFDPTLTTVCVTWLTAARSSARLKELGPMKIKTDLGWKLECSLNPKTQVVIIRPNDSLVPSRIFPIFLNRGLWISSERISKLTPIFRKCAIHSSSIKELCLKVYIISIRRVIYFSWTYINIQTVWKYWWMTTTRNILIHIKAYSVFNRIS